MAAMVVPCFIFPVEVADGPSATGGEYCNFLILIGQQGFFCTRYRRVNFDGSSRFFF